MINKENLTKLYRGILDNVELTTKELNEFGFNSKDLKDLIEQGNIIRIRRGLYSLKSVDGLFCFGKQLIAKKEYNKATQCFQKCHEIDPTHKGTCFQLFLRSIKNKDYKKAFEYFDIFFNSENAFYNADSNFYLYLLSMITELPENYRQYAKFLKFGDLKVDINDKRYTDTYSQNKIRTYALNQKFILAIKELNKNKEGKRNLSVQELVIKTLLSQVIEIKIQNINNVINLIKENKYEDIIELYEKKLSYHYLSQSDNYTLILAKELLNIINSKSIPQKQIFSTENNLEAIDGKNFELALALTIEKDQKNNVNKENNVIYLLLEKIVNKCKELKATTQEEKQSVTTQEKTFKESEQFHIIEPKSFSNSGTSSFIDVIKSLMKGDLDNSFTALRSYLASLDKSDYEFLIVDLIKISLLEKDIAFTKPMTALTLISREKYSFDIANYIQEFYINLSENKFEEARIYLDIISKGNKLGQECVITDGLYQVLETTERALNYNENNATLKKVDETLENSKKIKTNIEQQISYDNFQEESLSVAKPTSKTKVPDKFFQKEKITQETEKEFINKKYTELLDKKSIVLLKPMDSDKIDRIIELIENYPDMRAFVIAVGNKQQVVLKYKPTMDKYVDKKNLYDLGNKAYKEKNYDECIENYLQLLQYYDKPKSVVFSMLGLSYMKKQQIPLAIDYLTIATELSKKENAVFDFYDLIASLKGIMSKEDRKPRFIMTENDFDYNDNYGVDNFEEINSYIIESGLDVETACEELGLSLEETDIIKLIYARQFYTQENYGKGDMFLKSVERSKNKTQNTKQLLEEVRKNKRFYKNRKNSNNIEPVSKLLLKKK